MFCMKKEVPFSSELIVSKKIETILSLHGLLVTASCLLFAVDSALPSDGVLKRFTEIHNFGLHIGVP